MTFVGVGDGEGVGVSGSGARVGREDGVVGGSSARDTDVADTGPEVLGGMVAVRGVPRQPRIPTDSMQRSITEIQRMTVDQRRESV